MTRPSRLYRQLGITSGELLSSTVGLPELDVEIREHDAAVLLQVPDPGSRRHVGEAPAAAVHVEHVRQQTLVAVPRRADVEIEEAVEVVRWTEQAKRQNPAFKLVSDVYGIKTLA